MPESGARSVCPTHGSPHSPQCPTHGSPPSPQCPTHGSSPSPQCPTHGFPPSPQCPTKSSNNTAVSVHVYVRNKEINKHATHDRNDCPAPSPLHTQTQTQTQTHTHTHTHSHPHTHTGEKGIRRKEVTMQGSTGRGCGADVSLQNNTRYLIDRPSRAHHLSCHLPAPQ